MYTQIVCMIGLCVCFVWMQVQGGSFKRWGRLSLVPTSCSRTHFAMRLLLPGFRVVGSRVFGEFMWNAAGLSGKRKRLANHFPYGHVGHRNFHQVP